MTNQGGENPTQKRTYASPRLISYGNVRELTQGGTNNPTADAAPGNPAKT